MNDSPNGVELRVHATPRASKNEIQGIHDGALKIRLTAPPVDGKANQALIKFLSKATRISQSRIKLTQGETSRHKSLLIAGTNTETLLEILENKGLSA